MKAEIKERIRRTKRREIPLIALRNKVKAEEHFEIYRGLKRRGIKTHLHGPGGLRENAETAISDRGPGPARKKKEVYQSSGRGGDAQRCALVAKH